MHALELLSNHYLPNKRLIKPCSLFIFNFLIQESAKAESKYRRYFKTIIEAFSPEKLS